MFLRIAWALALLAGITGCTYNAGDVGTECLQDNNNNAAVCCGPGAHADHDLCCWDGQHAVSDVEHPDWKMCIYDEDAGTDARVFAHSDGGQDGGTDAP